MPPVVIQLIGFLGLIFLVLSFQQKKRTRILGFMLTGQWIFVIHFILLGAWTAVGMNIVGILRSLIFMISEKRKWANWKFWPVVFMFLFVIAALMAGEGWLGVLPMIAMIIETSGLWMKNLTKLRRISLLPHPFWAVYNLIQGSWAGVVTEIFVFSSIVVAIIRYDILKKQVK